MVPSLVELDSHGTIDTSLPTENQWPEYSLSFHDNAHQLSVWENDAQVSLVDRVDWPAFQQDIIFPFLTNTHLRTNPSDHNFSNNQEKDQSTANARSTEPTTIYLLSDGSTCPFKLGLPKDYSITQPERGLNLSIGKVPEPRTAILSGLSLVALLSAKRPKIITDS